MLMGCLMYKHPYFCYHVFPVSLPDERALMVIGCIVYNYRRGFCVARSTILGNARASKRGTGNMVRSPRFFCVVTSINHR